MSRCPTSQQAMASEVGILMEDLADTVTNKPDIVSFCDVRPRRTLEPSPAGFLLAAASLGTRRFGGDRSGGQPDASLEV